VIPSSARETQVWRGSANYDDRYSGKLQVTSERLVFEYRSGRLFRRGTASIQIPLAEISSISIERGPWNWNVLIVVSGDRTHRFIIREGDPEAWVGKIHELMNRKV
jgi:hypothetical protein